MKMWVGSGCAWPSVESPLLPFILANCSETYLARPMCRRAEAHLWFQAPAGAVKAVHISSIEAASFLQKTDRRDPDASPDRSLPSTGCQEALGGCTSLLSPSMLLHSTRAAACQLE